MEQIRYKAFPATNDFQIVVDRTLPDAFLDHKIAAEVDACWDAMKRQGTNLYDGLIFNVSRFDSHAIHGNFISYRYYVAWRKRVELHGRIPIKPLSVSGITFAKDEVLVGKRASHVHQYPGCYEFAPSGAVDKDSEDNGFINYRDLILKELEEETGISTKEVGQVELFSIIEDYQEESLELCLAIHLRHAFPMTPPTHEYEILIPWKTASMNSFLAQQPNDWVPMSLYIWQQWNS